MLLELYRPGELVEAVDGRDVVVGHPADEAALVLHLRPLARLVVVEHSHLVTCG